MPKNFKIDIFASDVKEARSMARSPAGILYVSTRTLGSVHAVFDFNGDFKADRVIEIAKGKFMPNGIAYRDGSLYLSEVNKLWRYKDIDSRMLSIVNKSVVTDMDAHLQPTLLTDKFPSDFHHGWKYIAFGPDGRMYIPVGAPCNACLRTDPRYATIMRQTNPNSWDFEVFASGVRNSVGFDFHPVTGDLWFTENGRDFLDHNIPPDELNWAPHSGLHFGYPYCFGNNVPDPELNVNRSCGHSVPAAQDLLPHAAALGVKFYTGNMFPPEYHNQVLIAEHGSWNRIPVSGYRVSLVKLEGNKAISYEEFIGGFVENDIGLGRPVDLLQLPDGSLLISDDLGNRIYRVTYSEK